MNENEVQAYFDAGGGTHLIEHIKDLTDGMKLDLEQKIASNNPDVSDVNFATNSSTNAVEITWRDPTNSDWAGTMIRRKLNEPPTGPEDGQLVGNSTTRNEHLTVPLTDPNPGSDDGSLKKYYYRFFPYDTNGTYSTHGKSYPYDVNTIIVSWENGSDEQIVAMLKAHHAGSINVRDYWSVGDERIDSSGKTLILIDNRDIYTLQKSDRASSRDYGAFCVLITNVSFAPYKTTVRQHTASRYKVADNYYNIWLNLVTNATIESNNNNIGPSDSVEDTLSDIGIGSEFRIFTTSLPNRTVTGAITNSSQTTGYTSIRYGSFDYTVTTTSTLQTCNVRLRPMSLKNIGLTDNDDIMIADNTLLWFNNSANRSSLIQSGNLSTCSAKNFSTSGSSSYGASKVSSYYEASPSVSVDCALMAKVYGNDTITWDTPNQNDGLLCFGTI